MYTKQIAQLDNLVNQYTVRGVLGLLAELATEKAYQCLQSANKWKEDGCPEFGKEDSLSGKEWVQLGRDLIALGRKHQLA